MQKQERNAEPVSIGGLRIEFPYVPYECQKSFMQKVVEALNFSTNAALESPTGTGKTLSLLCASIAWVQREKEKLKAPIQSNVENNMLRIDTSSTKNIADASAANPLYPRIFYASRTHSQLQQIVRELNKTKYRSVIKVATLAGRDQLCINEKIMKEQNSEKKGHMCRSLVNKRGCHYFNMLDKDGDLVEEIYNNECGGQAMDIEDLVATAKKLRHCPFYRSRQMYSAADLVLLPYNYILDPKTRDAYQIKLRGNILIFDEAHNLESIAEESMSMEFTTKALSLCIRECKKVLEIIMEEEEAIRADGDNSTVSFATLMKSKEPRASKKDQEKKLKKEDVASLLLFLQTFEEKIDAMDLTKEGISKVLIGVFLATNADGNSGIWAEKGTNLADFSNFIAKQGWISKPPQQKPSLSRLFQLYVLKDDSGATKFHYWCFSAGVAMRFLQSRGVHSIILASGTLSPMSTFVSTMSIPFGSVLENGHAAKPDQLIVGALRRGPANTDIVGTYQRRNDPTYKAVSWHFSLHILNSIFSSKLGKCPEGWVVLWPALEKHKKIFIEPKDKTAVKETFFAFDAAIREEHVNGGGALFLAVCRGKLSEGIDFADSHCRSVVIIGIPFPPLFDPRIVLKKSYLGELRKENPNAMNPEDWYKIEGVRAVNQALGRIIRHKDDFGAVILADGRYASMDKTIFPSWIRSAVKVHEGPKNMFLEIERFFIERGALIELSHSRLQDEFNHKSALVTRKRRGPAIRCEDVGEGRLNRSVAEFNSIIEMYGFSSQNPITLKEEDENKDVNAIRTAGSDTKELNKFADIMNTLPEGKKVYPKMLEFPVDARERAAEAVSLSTRRDVDIEPVKSNNKRVKLKPNPKLIETLKINSRIDKYLIVQSDVATTSKKASQGMIGKSSVEALVGKSYTIKGFSEDELAPKKMLAGP
uniref:Helicase ATP-binding domain-containing protein n=1 Tax=Ditylenchus dipsaci TaxID=166011 RepID=A0A915D8B6_9BILA